MAVVYDSNGGGANAVGTAGAFAITTTYPATINANDLLIAHIAAKVNTSIDSIATIAGWNLVTTQGIGTTLASAYYWKLAVGTEGGTTDVFTGTYTGTLPRMSCVIERYTGNVTSGTPVESAATGTGTSTTPAPASVTTSTNGGLAVFGLATQGTTTVTNITGETGGDYTEAYAESASTPMLDTQTAALATAGTISGGTCTLGTSLLWSVICFGIKAAAAVDMPLAIYYDASLDVDHLLTEAMDFDPAFEPQQQDASQDDAIDFLLSATALPDEAEYVELALDWNDWSWAQAPPNDEAIDFILGLEDATNVGDDPSSTDLTEYGAAEWLTPIDATDALPSIDDATNVAEDPSSTDLGEYGDTQASVNNDPADFILGTDEDDTGSFADPSQTDLGEYGDAQAPLPDDVFDFILGIDDGTNLEDPSQTDFTDFGWVVDPLSNDFVPPTDAILGAEDDGSNDFLDPSLTDLTEYGDTQAPPIADVFDFLLAATDDDTATFADPSQTDLDEYGWINNPIADDVANAILGAEDDGSNDFEEPSQTDLTEYGWVIDPLTADTQDPILGIEFPEFEDPSLTDHTDFGWVFNPIIEDVADAILGDEDDGSNDFEDPSLTDFTEYGDAQAPFPTIGVEDPLLGVDDGTADFADPSLTDLEEYGWVIDPAIVEGADLIPFVYDATDAEDPSFTDFTEYGATTDYLFDGLNCSYPYVASFVDGFSHVASGYTIALPSGIADGNVLILLIDVIGDFALANSFWHLLWTEVQSGGPGESLCGYYHVCDGTETTSSITPKTGSHAAQWSVLRIAGVHAGQLPEDGTSVSTLGIQINPLPSVTASWGADLNLFITCESFSNDFLGTGFLITSFPANYTTDRHQTGLDTVDNVGATIGWATRQRSLASDTPSSFITNQAADVAANTIVIRGACAAPSQDFLIGADDGSNDFEEPSLTDFADYGFVQEPFAPDQQDMLLGLDDDTSSFADPSQTDLSEYGWVVDPLSGDSFPPQDFLLGTDDGSNDFADPSLTDFTDFGSQAEPVTDPLQDMLLGVEDSTNVFSDPSLTDLSEYGWVVDPTSPNAPPAQDFLLGIDDATNAPDPSFTDLTEYGDAQAPAIPNLVPPGPVVPIGAPCLRSYQNGPPAVSVCNLDTFEQTCDTVVQLRNLIGTDGLQVSVRGLYTVGDGQGGVFIWNPIQIGGDDGFGIIFPTGGSATGAWARIGTFNTDGVLLALANQPAANPLGGYLFVGPDGSLFYRGPFTTTLIGPP